MTGGQLEQSSSARLSSKAAAAVREIYRPILRGYFTIFALYYTILTPFNYWYLAGIELILLVSASVIAAVVGGFGCWYMRKPAPAHRVELLLIAMNLAAVGNVLIGLNIEFAPEKLTYFVIMAMLFALASVNFRQSALSIGFSSLALISFFPRLDSATLSAYAFLTFGAAMASLAIAFFLRKAVTKIADAKIETEEELEKARIVSEDMREKSLSDSLTMLPNRRAFFATLRKTMREQNSTHPSDSIWLMLVDLDGFKTVNDIHGHLTGDLLLKQVAGRLELFAGEDIHVSRMGGDEFNMIFAGQVGEDEIRSRCDVLLKLLAETYIIDGRHIRISCSVGCKQMDLSESMRSQISQADYALMVAKRQGRNCAVLFDDVHAKQAQARYEIEQALRCADLPKEIDLVFQPQINLGSNAMVRAEALARWTSPNVGKIEPLQFIKIAEESGLITGITLVVVEKALSQLREWPEPIALSINLSGYDLISDPTIDQIIDLVKNYGTDPKLIEFEVTETAMMGDFDKATANLNRLADLGFSIALDDFGTGYSNFSYLRALPIEKLKVDRSFIQDPSDPMTEKILSSLAGMARILGVHCLLEGVEDEIELLMAKRVGAESVQGYYFGEPMSATDLLKLVQTSSSNPDDVSSAA
ncbi:EAL domain-containing protein [uncultured Erythrobacter sp.]|uniref:putative bifunctional diguanylate cyclase/phosphodiesterase n=1 Tax=uncultured Erythrobacter sp. TaxID=263913 RepID=UPI0026089334|nr:EAL domain-containing protein [uncultured Erythrobacter sp.]